MFFLISIVHTVFSAPIPLTADGQVKKILVREGDGQVPGPDQGVVIHYNGFLEDGTLFDSSRKRSEFTFRLGQGVIPGWSIGVGSMRVGELSNFTIGYEYGYGERGYPPVVPAKADLHFEIELLGLA
jgi:FKBP-type peptidyl-prolyl cis-trans isomerase